MPILFPTKMSLFENVTSLSTSSYIIGLDMYGGTLANVKISSSMAGYDIARKRWILNPPVSSPSDTRGDDGAESYSEGQHWIKSGSVWLQLIQTGSGGGTISSSYQLSDGGGNAFDVSNNVTFGRLNSDIITGSTVFVTGNASIGTSTSNTHVVSGSIVTNGPVCVNGDTLVTGSLTVQRTGTTAYGYYINGTGVGRIGVQSPNMIVGGQTSMATVIQSNATNMLVFDGASSYGYVTSGKKFGFGKIPTTDLDVTGSMFLTGSLNVTKGITGSLFGTASYALSVRSNNVFNVKDYGAIGDGSTNDTTAILAAISAAQSSGNGTVYFPDGTFNINAPLTLPSNPQCDIAIVGDGPNVSVIKQTTNANAINFNMETGVVNDQQYQVSIRDIGFKTTGQASASIYVTYGTTSTSSHQNISVDISDVHILSDGSNYWTKGIVLESAWNFRISNTMVVGQTVGTYPYNGTGLEVRRMCVNGSINQSQFNFWKTGIFVNTVDYSSAGMNTEGLFLDQVYMVPVNYGVYIRGNKNFSSSPFNSVDWANRYIAGRMVLFTLNGSHIDSRDSGSALLLENVQSHYITNNLMITDGTGSVVRGLNAHEGSLSGNTFFNAGTAPSLYIGGYSGSANIVTGNVFRGGTTHVFLETSSLYNKVYGNVAYDQLSISVTDSGTGNLVGSVGN